MTNKLEWWIRTMLRHRIKTLAMVLMVTGLAGLLFSQLEIRTALLDMIKKSSERAETYETMRQHFGSDTIMLVGIDDVLVRREARHRGRDGSVEHRVRPSGTCPRLGFRCCGLLFHD